MSLSSESDEQYVSENQQSMYGSIYFMMLYLLFFFSRISEGYYKDNLSLPVFMTGTATLLPEEKVKTLLRPHPPERLCKVVPTNVAHNVTFLLDTTALNSLDDWKCDDMEAWRNNGRKQSTFKHRKGQVKAINAGGAYLKHGTTYTLVRMYYKNKTCSDIKKFVSYLKGRFVFSRIVYVNF